jgi:diaminohydroxyphosphoribosylaminopyrimidine deaminase/5-amino-6-(5-phosphoribosylamino)uracil reductase
MAERPFVTLKLATSLDGRIAMASGESRWITSETARFGVQVLRADHDAILVGIGTVLADDPALTLRLEPPRERPLLRVILDSRQRIPMDAKLVATARITPTLVLTLETPQLRLLEAGVRVRQVGADAGQIDLDEALALLADEGVTRLLVEGGGHVAASFVRQDLVDRIEWFRAPILLGAAGRPAIAELPIERLPEAPRYRRWMTEDVGGDLWERYERA